MYQAQYMEKDFKNGNSNNEKKSDSQHKGIGIPYFLQHFRQILSLGYIPFGERKIPVPRTFQKVAHKHWSHFYEPTNFFDTSDRKALYTPFKPGLENKDIADLYILFKNNKNEKIQQLEDEWNEVITNHLKHDLKPEFIKSAENYLYDLKNKNTKGAF